MSLTPEDLAFEVWFVNRYGRKPSEDSEEDLRIKAGYYAGYLEGVVQTRIRMQHMMGQV